MKKYHLFSFISLPLIVGAMLISCQSQTVLETPTQTEPPTEASLTTQTPECTAHTWGEWTVIKEASKLEDGQRQQLCTTCNTPNTEIIHATGSQGLRYASTESGIIVEGIGACSDADLIIPAYHNGKPIVAIKANAFLKCSKIQTVTLLGNVTDIGQFVFSQCPNLEKVTLCDSVKTLGAQIFSFSPALTEVVLSKELSALPYAAFLECSSLKKVVIPDSTTAIGEYCFRDCPALEEITIGAGVLQIGKYAFYGCQRLTSVEIPDGVTSIEEMTFGLCSSLTEVVIPKSVRSISEDAFWACESLSPQR